MGIKHSKRTIGRKPNGIAGKAGCTALCLLMLAGCSGQQTRYILIDGNVTKASGEYSDWQLTAGGKPRDLYGNVSVRVGIEQNGYSAYAGVNHYSLADYGQDIGVNGAMVGISKRIEF